MTDPWLGAHGGVIPSERQWLKDAAADVARRYEQPTIVNIGVLWYASMYCLREGAPTARLVGVDIIPSAVKVPPGLNAEFIWEDSRVCHVGFEDSIHLLFVDGDHRYSGVRADITNWIPKVVPGGLVAFHDYAPTKKHLASGLRGVRRAVDAWSVEAKWTRLPAPGKVNDHN